MINEPKKPMLQDYPGGWDGITQYVVDTNDYVNRLEAEVERLKSRLNATHVAAEQLQSDLSRCKSERLGESGRRFANVYEDANGRFISDLDWDSYEEAYKQRDEFDTYVETVELVRASQTDKTQEGKG